MSWLRKFNWFSGGSSAEVPKEESRKGYNVDRVITPALISLAVILSIAVAIQFIVQRDTGLLYKSVAVLACLLVIVSMNRKWQDYCDRDSAQKKVDEYLRECAIAFQRALSEFSEQCSQVISEQRSQVISEQRSQQRSAHDIGVGGGVVNSSSSVSDDSSSESIDSSSSVKEGSPHVLMKRYGSFSSALSSSNTQLSVSELQAQENVARKVTLLFKMPKQVPYRVPEFEKLSATGVLDLSRLSVIASSSDDEEARPSPYIIHKDGSFSIFPYGQKALPAPCLDRASVQSADEQQTMVS